MPPQITCASALPGKKWNTKIAFFTRALVHCQNVTNCCLISSTFLTHAAVWLPKSCNQCVQLGAVGGMVQEKGSREYCSSWTVLHAQSNSALSSGYPLLQSNDEALDRWGWNTNDRLISNYLSDTSAKHYRNRIVYVKIIASQRWDGFLRHSVHMFAAMAVIINSDKQLSMIICLSQYAGTHDNKLVQCVT